jgi:hypothetical protein
MAAPSADKASDWAERLEHLAHYVPGLGRYQDREGLRETDKQVRVYLADLMTNLVRMVEGEERRLTEAGRLDRLPALDRVARRLGTLADRVRFASYGFAGVFDLHKIRETELATLHRFDLSLVEAVPRLRTPLQTLADVTTDESAFPETLRRVETALQEFEATLVERDRLLRGL